MSSDADARGGPGAAGRLKGSARAARAALVACCALAAGLGAWNLGFGLPFLFRPDEDVMVGRAVRMAVEHSFDPLFYNYPPLAFYLFAAAERGAALLPGVQLGPATEVNPSIEYLAARAVSMLAGVAAVGLTWAAGARAYGVRAGTIAAAALAVAPLAVREAHFATTDAIQLALVALALWTGVRASNRAGFALAGLACGAAAATKYTAAATLVYVAVLAFWGRPWRAALPDAAAAAGAFAGGLAALFLPTGHARLFLQGVLFLGDRATSYGNMPPGWLYHLTQSLPFGLGLGTFAVVLAGVVVAARRRSRIDVALLAYAAAAYLPIAASHEVFFRYALPLFPALCLLAGGALRAVPVRLAPAAAAAFALLLFPSAWNSFQGDRLLGVTDTRQLAAAWLEANAPAGDAVSVGSYWGQPFYSHNQVGNNPLHPYYATGNEVADSFEQGLYTSRFKVTPSAAAASCYRLLESPAPWQTPSAGWDGGPSVAEFSPGSPGAWTVYDRLDAFYLPIWGFDGVQRPGPAILIRARC